MQDKTSSTAPRTVADRTERLRLPPPVEDYRPTADSGRATSSESLTNAGTPLSMTGIVDAILEVGHQRLALLGQVRSALMSGNDAEALRCARQLCGLPD